MKKEDTKGGGMAPGEPNMHTDCPDPGRAQRCLATLRALFCSTFEKVIVRRQRVFRAPLHIRARPGPAQAKRLARIYLV